MRCRPSSSRTAVRSAIAVAVAVTAATACSGGSSSPSVPSLPDSSVVPTSVATTSPMSTPPPPTSTTVVTTMTVPVPPVRIGWVNDDVRFPGARRGFDEALAEGDGLAGRPVEVVECPVASSDDGRRCAERFVSQDVAAVLTGVVVDGGRALYDTLEGRVPVLIGTAVTVDDLTTPAGILATSGPAGLAAGLAAFVVERSADDPGRPVAVLVDDDAAGRTLVDLFVTPVLSAAGRAVTLVPVPGGDTDGSAVAEAWSAAGSPMAEGDPAVVVDLLGPGRCGLVAGLTDAVGVTTGGCTADTGDVPVGWYVVHPGSSPPAVVAGDDAGEGWWTAGPVRAAVAGLDAALARVGPDDPAALLDALRRAPSVGWQTGPVACGEVTILGIDQFDAVCGSTVAVHRRTAEGWEPVRTDEVGGLVDVPA